MSDYINWDLIAELHSVEKTNINFIQEMLTEKSLLDAGWDQKRLPAAFEYKKVWALMMAVEPGLSDAEVIDKHLKV